MSLTAFSDSIYEVLPSYLAWSSVKNLGKKIKEIMTEHSFCLYCFRADWLRKEHPIGLKIASRNVASSLVVTSADCPFTPAESHVHLPLNCYAQFTD